MGERFYVLNVELWETRAFPVRLCVCGGYVDVSDVAVFSWQLTSRSVCSLSGRKSVGSCELKLRVDGKNTVGCVYDVTP